MICPHCKQEADSSPVGFTWWGGFIGSKLINHVRCSSCGQNYNGRTGQLNTGAIAIYMVVVSLLAFGVAFVAFRH